MKFCRSILVLSFVSIIFLHTSALSQSVTKGTIDVLKEYENLNEFEGKNIAGGGARLAFYLDEQISKNYLTLDSLKQWLIDSKFKPENQDIQFKSDVKIIPNYPVADGVFKDVVVVAASLKLNLGMRELNTRWTMISSSSAYYTLFSGHAASKIEGGKLTLFKIKQVSPPKIDYPTSGLVLNIQGPKTGTITITHKQGYPVFKDSKDQSDFTTGRFENGSTSFSNITAGIYEIVVKSPGYQTVTKSGVVIDPSVSVNTEEVSLLAERVTTKFTVTTEDGTPIAPFDIKLTDQATKMSTSYTGTKYSEEFIFPLGSYMLEVKSDGYQTLSQALELTTDDIATGKPVFIRLKKADFKNVANKNVKIELTVIESDKNKELSKYILIIKNDQGQVVTSLPPGKTRNTPKIQLSPGNYTFEVDLKGYNASPEDVFVSGNLENQSVTITMNKGNSSSSSNTTITKTRTGGKFWAFLVLAGAGGAYYLTQSGGSDNYGTPPALPSN